MCSKPIKEITHKNCIIKIHQDENPESPRDWDNIGVIVSNHKRYDLGDKNTGINMKDFNSWDEVKQFLLKKKKAILVLPIYMFDHSGITISTQPFSCPWDSGQVGFIYVTKEKIKESYMKKNITKKLLDQVQENLISEIKTYDSYLRGGVFGYEVLDSNGNDMDSCWGYYNLDDTISTAMGYIDNEAA